MKRITTVLTLSLILGLIGAAMQMGGAVVRAQEWEDIFGISVTHMPEPTTAGNAVQFDVSWDDPFDVNSAIICKTDEVDAGSCPGGGWTSLSPPTNEVPVNLFYTTTNSDIGSNAYYAFVCDNLLACTSSVSGSFTVVAAEGGDPPGGGGDPPPEPEPEPDPEPEGPPTEVPFGYADGDLVQVSGQQAVYAIVNGVFVGIPDVSTFNARRYSWDDIITIPYSEIGDIVPAYTFYPEGAVIRAINDIDVWIVKYAGEKQFRRLVLNPTVFNSYGHLRWEDVRDVSPESVNAFTESFLVYVVGTPDQAYRLTPDGDIGTRQRISDSAIVSLALDAEGAYEINATDYENYTEGAPLE